MDMLAWAWWLLTIVVGAVLSLVWFLISGWVSTLLQIALLIVVVYFLKYGWRRAPNEIWRRTSSFGRFFLNWIRARDAPTATSEPVESARVVRSKEFGDINISTLLTLLMLAGLLLASQL